MISQNKKRKKKCQKNIIKKLNKHIQDLEKNIKLL